tara:strand:- start:162 stop:608 length:447 start_codon:yes stop_codon:yes gene_type:complete
MELNTLILDQKNNFCKERGTEMSKEEYTVTLITYPAFLVANADGDFDNDERELMSQLLQNFLREIYGEELSSEQYSQMISAFVEDFEWVAKNNQWKDDLLAGLKILCNDISGLSETIIGMMQEMAEVSENVSKEEANMIIAVSNSLSD